MVNLILSPPAVIRKLNFSSPLHPNGEGEKETKKKARKRKRKLINETQTKPVSYSYMAFGKDFTLYM